MDGCDKVGFMPTFCFQHKVRKKRAVVHWIPACAGMVNRAQRGRRSDVLAAGRRGEVHRQTVNLDNLLRPVIADMGYVCWGIEHVPQGRGSLLRVYIDSDTGITLEDCEQVSQRLSGTLDVEDPIAGEYLLEVSSPGLDRLLFTRAQYEQFIGELVKVRLAGAIEQRKRITGRIQEVTGQDVILNEAGREFRIPLAIIERARLCPNDINRTDKR